MTNRKRVSPEALDSSLLPKQRKPIPHAFVLDAISTLSPYTRPMFGCLAIYVKDKIVLILRDKPKSTADNGVWLATTHLGVWAPLLSRRDTRETVRGQYLSRPTLELLSAP